METQIVSTGSYFPETKRTNADLEKLVETTDEWIMKRTGIKERRVPQPHETVSYMAEKAAQDAIRKAELHPQHIRETSVICAHNTGFDDFIIIPTHASKELQALNISGIPSFDAVFDTQKAFSDIANAISSLFPSTNAIISQNYVYLEKDKSFKPYEVKADPKKILTPHLYTLTNALKQNDKTAHDLTCLVHHHERRAIARTIASNLGADGQASFDISNGCVGGVTSDILAHGIQQHRPHYVLTTAADDMPKVTNMHDRATIVLFGAYAGSKLLAPSDKQGVIAYRLVTDTSVLECAGLSKTDLIKLIKYPGIEEEKFWQDGQSIFRLLCEDIPHYAQEAKASLNGHANITYIPHQANPRIIKDIIARNDIFKDLSFINIGDWAGNGSCASTQAAFDHAIMNGQLARGQPYLIQSFGVGFCHGWLTGIF